LSAETGFAGGLARGGGFAEETGPGEAGFLVGEACFAGDFTGEAGFERGFAGETGFARRFEVEAGFAGGLAGEAEAVLYRPVYSSLTS